MEEINMYQRFGGDDFVKRLVHAFYDRVFEDDELKPLFANSLPELVREKQYLFLSQFLGGPSIYSERFGHPMLRARHLPFEITPTRAKAWLKCMFAAMDDIQMPNDSARDYLQMRFMQVAQHMVNHADD